MSQVYFGSDLISSLESKDFGFKDTTNKVKSTNVQDAIVEVAGKACNEVELTQAEYEELEKNGGVLADVNYYITDGEAGGGSGDGCKKIECTLAEYEEWEAAGTIDPTTLYFITDGDSGLNARTIVYNNTESGMTSGNVQDAIDELNANLDIVNSGLDTINIDLVTLQSMFNEITSTVTYIEENLGTLTTEEHTCSGSVTLTTQLYASVSQTVLFDKIFVEPPAISVSYSANPGGWFKNLSYSNVTTSSVTITTGYNESGRNSCTVSWRAFGLVRKQL